MQLLHDLRDQREVSILEAGTCPQRGGQVFYARLPSPGSATIREAVGRAASSGAAGVVLSGIGGGADIERLGAMLAVAEAEQDLPDGGLRIVAIADSPAAILALPSLRPTRRLAGLGCDPTRLAGTLACEITAHAVVTARALTVLAASACGARAVLLTRDSTPELRRTALAEGFSAILTDGEPIG